MPAPTPAIELAAASSRTDEELAALFGAVYADYFVPVHVDAILLRTMARRFDLDLAASRVALAGGQDAGLALLGLREEGGWVGGMGVVPAARRSGIGRRLMEALIGQARDRGRHSVRLEVLEQNAGAIALYRAIGFREWRALEVWTLAAPAPDEGAGGAPAATGRAAAARAAGAGEIAVADARAWITARRTAPEPWQREDASLDRFDLPESPLRALEVTAGGTRTGAALVLVAGGRASLMQLEARGADPVASARALVAAAGAWAPAVRFLNVPTEHAAATALAAAGATLEARQFEMTLALAHGTG